jgi:radical SAM superfamily enzyme YgiQ (UPF0313 family)
VVAGGHAAFNPEPISDFIDCAVLGDGDEAVLDITEVVRAWKAEGRPGGRDELLLRLSRRAASTSRASTTSTTCPDGRIQRVVPNRPGVPFRVQQAHGHGPRQLALPEAAARAARRDGARADERRDLPRLHARAAGSARPA